MRRRDFITLLGGAAAAWPLTVRAQSRPMPVIGFLNSGAEAAFAVLVNAFRQGLGESHFVEGQNVAIEYRWAEGKYDRLPELASDLVRRQVALIAATGGTMSARAAKAATETIPILFVAGSDPVKAGLVASTSRPGGNATGVNVYTTAMVGKRLELLRELLPSAATIGMLVNPGAVSVGFERKFAAATEHKDTAAGVKLLVFEASAENDFETAFEAMSGNGVDALLVSADPFFTNRRDTIVTLAAKHALPAVYPWRLYAAAGGLTSYGPSIAEAYRQVGRYAGRILKGEKPQNLPVQWPNTFELVINLKTARALELRVSPWLLARADEVIE